MLVDDEHLVGEVHDQQQVGDLDLLDRPGRAGPDGRAVRRRCAAGAGAGSRRRGPQAGRRAPGSRAVRSARRLLGGGSAGVVPAVVVPAGVRRGSGVPARGAVFRRHAAAAATISRTAATTQAATQAQ